MSSCSKWYCITAVPVQRSGTVSCAQAPASGERLCSWKCGETVPAEESKIFTARLLLVGEGEMLTELQKEAARLSLDDVVIFYGTSTRVEELLWAMDVFVFPSIFEGLGIVAIEAQGNGLPVLVSDKVSQEAKLQNDYMIVPLSLPAGVWAVKALSYRECGRMRERGFSEVREAGFSIQSEAVNLQTYYVTKNL